MNTLQLVFNRMYFIKSYLNFDNSYYVIDRLPFWNGVFLVKWFVFNLVLFRSRSHRI